MVNRRLMKHHLRGNLRKRCTGASAATLSGKTTDGRVVREESPGISFCTATAGQLLLNEQIETVPINMAYVATGHRQLQCPRTAGIVL